MNTPDSTTPHSLQSPPERPCEIFLPREVLLFMAKLSISPLVQKLFYTHPEDLRLTPEEADALGFGVSEEAMAATREDRRILCIFIPKLAIDFYIVKQSDGQYISLQQNLNRHRQISLPQSPPRILEGHTRVMRQSDDLFVDTYYFPSIGLNGAFQCVRYAQKNGYDQNTNFLTAAGLFYLTLESLGYINAEGMITDAAPASWFEYDRLM
jgi:hypothetical protein